MRIVGEATGHRSARVPIISFCLDGVASADLVRRVDAARIGIRHGDFHSRRLVEALGVAPGSPVRVSMVHYNTQAEVDRLIEAFERALK